MFKRLHYLHYFLVEMFVDISIIVAVIAFAFESKGFPFYAIFVTSGTWLIGNIISYPKGNRRYISYIHTLYRVVQPFIFFCLFYVLFLEIFFSGGSFGWNVVKYFIVLFACLTAGKFGFVLFLRIYRRLGYGFSNFIIIGAEEEQVRFENFFRNRSEGGFRYKNGIPWTDDLTKDSKKLNEYIKGNQVDEIYLSPNELHGKLLSQIIDVAKTTGIELYLLPGAAIRYIKFYNFRLLNGNSVVEVFRGPLINPINKWRKRLFDVVFSAIVIVFVLSWLLPLLAICIKLDSKGPVFFVQLRAGKGGKMFKCFKLRTMLVNDNADLVQATKDDKRVTRIGNFLRSNSLDELPQFFNTLIGTMSVVGPRPHIKVLNEQFENNVNSYYKRMWVKPGITGLSQTYGYRGRTEGVTQMKQRVNADIVYIMNWSLLLDLRIVWKTITGSFLVGDKNAY